MKIGYDVRADKDTVIKHTDDLLIGNHVAIDKGFYCTTRLYMGNYIHISPYVTIIGGKNAYCKIGSFVTISAGARLICVGDTFWGDGLVGPLIPDEYRNSMWGIRILIQDFANICTNAVISPGVVIGKGAVVGANSFVSHDIPDWEVWAGSPARFIKKRNSDKMLEYANKLGYVYESILAG